MILKNPNVWFGIASGALSAILLIRKLRTATKNHIVIINAWIVSEFFQATKPITSLMNHLITGSRGQKTGNRRQMTEDRTNIWLMTGSIGHKFEKSLSKTHSVAKTLFPNLPYIL